jgi:RNA processing factor Prp31
VGARLISHAGSLAKYPASTVQILVAKKALFRYWGTHSLLGKLAATMMAGLGLSREG